MIPAAEQVENLCTYCEAVLAEADIDLERKVARCGHCHAVFGFSKLGEPAPRWEKPLGPLPSGFSLEQAGDRLQITRTGFGIWAVQWIVLGLVVLGLLGWNASGWVKAEIWPISLFIALVFGGGSLGVIYYGFAKLLNRSTVAVEAGRLTVRHGPLPWGRNFDLAVGDLLQLYCTESIRPSRYGSYPIYGVRAILRRERRLQLLNGLLEPEQALFIEQTLEGYLGIVDRPSA